MVRGLLFILATALLVCGCDKKAPECQSIERIVDPASEKVSKLSDPDLSQPEQAAEYFKTVAKIFGDTSADLGKLTLTVPELAKFSADFQASSKQMSEADYELADAYTAHDNGDAVVLTTKLKASSEKMEAAQKNLKPLLTNLTNICK